MKKTIYRIITMILLPILFVVGILMYFFEADAFLFVIWGVGISILVIIGYLISDKQNKGIKITVYCIAFLLALYSFIYHNYLM